MLAGKGTIVLFIQAHKYIDVGSGISVYNLGKEESTFQPVQCSARSKPVVKKTSYTWPSHMNY